MLVEIDGQALGRALNDFPRERARFLGRVAARRNAFARTWDARSGGAARDRARGDFRVSNATLARSNRSCTRKLQVMGLGGKAAKASGKRTLKSAPEAPRKGWAPIHR